MFLARRPRSTGKAVGMSYGKIAFLKFREVHGGSTENAEKDWDLESGAGGFIYRENWDKIAQAIIDARQTYRQKTQEGRE
jgi:hypothetical protein